ncbi:hypothetical protein [Aureimonas sp. D3]|uniref:hypothetical protein n=1 Tax=Aureimonas sp. D3 TaxID=1638164 RepID=UPI000786572D|nr:hypothetical protein [Aureimonas sp. D3]
MSKSRSKRRTRRSGAGAALLRAMLLVGPLALAIVVGLSPRFERSLSGDGIDMSITGSVAPSSFSFAMGAPSSPSYLNSCLRFPDGSQRGAC